MRFRMQNRCKAVFQCNTTQNREKGSLSALKRTGIKKQIALLLAAALALALLAACGSPFARVPAATVDPYAGMVQVESGFGTKMWVQRHEELAESAFLGWSRLQSVPAGYTVEMGVDVSEHQGEIDWRAVKKANIDFAILRAGYRGYGEAGRLVEDACFRDNLSGALSAGIPVGIYFFSQAVTPEEAEEEADFLLEMLKDVPQKDIALPVFFDWEDISHDTARTDGLDGETITACAIAFCERVAAAGYTPGLYAYRYLAYFNYDLPRLSDYALWVGALGAESDFYYAHEFWQNAVAEGISGISGAVDRNFRFVKQPEPVETET